MKILGQVVSVQPLALIISLPNQLFAHVPITEISTQLTGLLESMEDDDDDAPPSDEEDDGPSKSRIPDLFHIFPPGQYVRAVVSAVHPPGATDASVLGRARDEVQKASRRIELSLIPEKVNASVSKSDLRAGFTLSAAVKSIEDHGYILDLGIPDVSGFLSFKEAKKGPFGDDNKLPVGRLIDVCVVKITGNGRTCTVSVDFASVRDASLSEVASVTSILPGTLVQSLVTAVVPDGLNLQVLGYFGGTIDQFHLRAGDVEENYKVGQKIKARILYDVSPSTPPRFALSVVEHVLKLSPKHAAGSDGSKDSSLQDAYPVGAILEAVKVVRVEAERGLVVEISSGLEGFVHISQVSDEHVPSLSPSSGHWKVGTVHKARVTGHFHLDGCLQLSFRPSVLEQKFLQVGEVQVGELIKGTVKRLTDSALFVSMSGSVDGVVWPNHYADIALKHPQRRFRPGVVAELQKDKAVITLQPTQVRALLSLNNLANRRGVSLTQLRTSLKTDEKLQDLVVVSRNPEKGFVLVATKPKEKESLLQRGSLNLDTIQVGQVVGGRVLRHGRQGALVKLTSSISGTLHPTDTCDDFDSGRAFPPVDSILKAVVLSIDRDKRQLTLSTRPSRLYPDQAKDVKDHEVDGVSDLKVGQTVRGFIKNVAEQGIFVMLGRHIDARVQIKELFDEYVKDWKSHFAANQLVKGRVLSVDFDKKQVEMTFRSGDLKRDARSQSTLADLSEGQKVDGRVKKIEDYGLFIEIAGSKLSGLCHKSELSDNKDADVTLALRSFRENDQVKAVILSIDREKRRISFGLKPSYFADDDFESSDDDNESTTGNDGRLGVVDDITDIEDSGDGSSDDDDAPVGTDDMKGDDSDDDSEAADDGAVAMDIDVVTATSAEQTTNITQTNSLSLQDGFQWSAKQDAEDTAMVSSEENTDDDEQGRKKKRRKRKEIEQDLTADMHTKMPESNTDFERVLLGSPNSSYLWIQYMSFQLQISEVEKAREIARRALRTINFREEQEKLNVWVALLNLENSFGTDESLEATFKDAARHNDSKTIHLRLANILDQSEKHEKAEEQYKRTCKKFSQSSKVWTLFGEHYLKRGMLEEARKLLPRSLQSLEKRKRMGIRESDIDNR
ncbi:hypothetical protein POSPLADRAFT_1127292 [Postia placenta MAD-698-R-SB12]|uniref:S1 motif domain-containing protein n=1 Tax=Postia placenta MAD-698-R-SB12 TaxID=670580 RepID=A0A1X6NFL0_9APHY|nr:hypothetical protein POSPLADRAFT_1127292 [Postia placenta MAD-698-R-SB12]OSX67310.1 hypothetical protein POSPLADRAFT_1127292 [Postia placenta MAD-698-R-SB12]